MESSFGKYDELLLGMLKEQKHFHGFFDAIFGFLYRCSDFYQISTSEEEVVGLPPGMSEEVIHYYYKKWSNKTNEYVEPPDNQETVISNVVHEEEVMSVEEPNLSEEISNDLRDDKKINASKDVYGECYNGAKTDKYSWSQSITDVDVNIQLPIDVKSAKQLTVKVDSKHLRVSIKDHPNPLIDGDLPWPCRHKDIIWSISNGVLQIHLDKQQERWWDQFFTYETKIDLKNMDCSRPLEDLSEEAQAKIQELRWNQEQKLLGKPTSEQLKNSRLLKQAWNLEGSPFKGTKFDPTTVHFEQGSIN